MNLDRIPPQPPMTDALVPGYLEALRKRLATPEPGDTRACPDCGRPQHYTGTEHGWAHDALIDTWDCADPARHNPVTCRDGDHYGQCSGVTI